MSGSRKIYPILGDDLLNTLFGDSLSFLPKKKGRDSTIDARGGDDMVYGDALSMLGKDQGGNDRMSGGDGLDTLFGDAQDLAGRARGGNDRIDAGADTIRSTAILRPCQARPAAATTASTAALAMTCSSATPRPSPTVAGPATTG